MKIKLNKHKFIRNIVIGVISLIIVACIINYAPGYERDKYDNIINLVIGSENITEDLKNLIYIDDKGSIYMSKDDIANLFDSDIYYDETYEAIITTSNIKVASMKLQEKEITINGAKIPTLGTVFRKDGILYIPISELEIVYNISADYIEESNTVIIDRLDEGMIVADVSKITSLKYKPRNLSKDVIELEDAEKVTCFYTTSKGWRLVRTSKGELRICKSKCISK